MASGEPLTRNYTTGVVSRIDETVDTVYAQHIAPVTVNADLLIDANGVGEIGLGKNGAGPVQNTHVYGDLNVDGAEVVTGGTTFNGDVTIGDAAADKLIINASLASHIIPDANNAYTIGDMTFGLAELWLVEVGGVTPRNLNSSVAGAAGAKAIGVDPAPLTYSASTDLQSVLGDLDSAIGAADIFQVGAGTLSAQRKGVGLTTAGDYAFNTGLNNNINAYSDYAVSFGQENVVAGTQYGIWTSISPVPPPPPWTDAKSDYSVVFGGGPITGGIVGDDRNIVGGVFRNYVNAPLPPAAPTVVVANPIDPSTPAVGTIIVNGDEYVYSSWTPAGPDFFTLDVAVHPGGTINPYNPNDLVFVCLPGTYNFVQGFANDIGGKLSTGVGANVVFGGVHTIYDGVVNAVFGTSHRLVNNVSVNLVSGEQHVLDGLSPAAGLISGHIVGGQYHNIVAICTNNTVSGYQHDLNDVSGCGIFGVTHDLDGSESCLVGGLSNIVDNVRYCVIGGTANDVHGGYSPSACHLVVGDTNTINYNAGVGSARSGLIGGSNVIGAAVDTLASFAIGDSNTLDGSASIAYDDYNYAFGDSNAIAGGYNMAVGYLNTLADVVGCFAQGLGHTITTGSDYTSVFGVTNTIGAASASPYSIVVGSSSDVDGDPVLSSGYNCVFGTSHDIDADFAFTSGSGNTIQGALVGAFGAGLTAAAYTDFGFLQGMLNTVNSGSPSCAVFGGGWDTTVGDVEGITVGAAGAVTTTTNGASVVGSGTINVANTAGFPAPAGHIIVQSASGAYHKYRYVNVVPGAPGSVTLLNTAGPWEAYPGGSLVIAGSSLVVGAFVAGQGHEVYASGCYVGGQRNVVHAGSRNSVIFGGGVSATRSMYGFDEQNVVGANSTYPYCQWSFSHGVGNTVDYGVQFGASVAWGGLNVVYGDFNFAYGVSNSIGYNGGSPPTLATDTSVAFGYGNIIYQNQHAIMVGGGGLAQHSVVGAVAVSSYSIVWGREHTVDGNAIGCNTVFGKDNDVDADYVFAVGNLQTVSGDASSAMGESHTVSGDWCVAGGYNHNIASDYTTAFGQQNVTSSGSDHAVVEGYNNNVGATQATTYGVAVGRDNTLDSRAGSSSYDLTAVGHNNTVKGYQNIALGISNTIEIHASGAIYNCYVLGSSNNINPAGVNSSVAYSGVFGYSNNLYASQAYCIGVGSSVYSNYAGSMGYSNNVGRATSFTNVQGSWAIGYSNAIGNAGTTETAQYSYILGYSNNIGNSYNSDYAIALGYDNDIGTSAEANYGFALGYANSVQANYGGAIGDDNTVTGRSWTVGASNSVSADYSFASGWSNQVDSGECTVGGRSNVIYDAVGSGVFGFSHTVGQTNYASPYSLVAGSNNIVYGSASEVGYNLVIGYSIAVNADYVVAFGNDHVIGKDYGMAFGKQASPNWYAAIAHAGDQYSNVGDTQNLIDVPLTTRTTAASWTRFYPDGVGGSENLSLVDGDSLCCSVLVTAKSQSDSGQTKQWELTFGVDRSGATSILVGSAYNKTVISSTSAGSESTWDVRVVVNDTSDQIEIDAYGQASKNILWQASMRAARVLAPAP